VVRRGPRDAGPSPLSARSRGCWCRSAPTHRGQACAGGRLPFAADASAYRKAEALARNARHIADLDEKLYENGGLARRDMEQAETNAISAEADRDAARQQLR